MTYRRRRSRIEGGIQLEQLTLLAVVGVGVLGVMGGLGSAVSTTLIGDGSEAGGGSGSVPADPLAGATWDPSAVSPGGAGGSGAGGPEWGGGIGGDEPSGLGGDGVGGDEAEGAGAGDPASVASDPSAGDPSAGDPSGGDPSPADPTVGDSGALTTSGESRLDECDHPATFANILRSNWDRVRGADRDKPDDRIDTEDLESIAADASAPPDLRAAADFFLRNRSLLHVLERGGEGGDDNGQIGRDDLDTAIAALEELNWDAFRAGIDPDMSVEEAQAWIASFRIAADIAAGRGEIDGDVSHDDLRALLGENECLGEGARAAAQSVIDNVPEPEECSGFSLCHFDGAIDAIGDAGEWVGDRWEDVHEIRRGVRDWVGDRIADGQRLANEGLTWVGERATELDDWVASFSDNPWFRYNPLYWGVRGATAFTAHVQVPFTRGAVNGVFGIVDGLYTLGGFAEGLVTGDPETYRGLYDFAHLAVTDPGAAWDQAFEVGRAIYHDYEEKVLACVGADASVAACSEAIGELAPDIALTILTGGAGKAATGAGTAARFAATHADDVGRVADDVAGAANHIDDVASHADDAAGHADDAAAHADDAGRVDPPNADVPPLTGGLSSADATAALTNMRNNGGHAIRHLRDEGIIANRGSLASQVEEFSTIARPALQDPLVTPFHWRVGGGDTLAYLTRLEDGRVVGFFVAQEGPWAGRVVSAFVPDPDQLAQMSQRAGVDIAAHAAAAPTRRLVVGGGRAEGFPALRENDVALNIDAQGANPHVVGDINDPPFRPGSFDDVVFENVQYDSFTGANSGALRESYDLLRPGGELRITTGSAAPADDIAESARAAGFENVTIQSTPTEVLRDDLARRGLPESQIDDIIARVEASGRSPGWMITGTHP
jgi:hypothetical protein